MAQQMTTRQAKAWGMNTQQELRETEEMWVQDFGYTSAELKPSAKLGKGGRVVDDPDRWTLWLDGELSEVEYGWFRQGNSIWFTETHNG